jgi:hypothetical protein
LLVLAGSGLLALKDAAGQIGSANSQLQQAVMLSEFVYGFFGLAAAVGMLADKDWAVRAATAWAVVVTFTAPAAAVGYGGQNPFSAGTLGAIVATALVAAFVRWLTVISMKRDYEDGL